MAVTYHTATFQHSKTQSRSLTYYLSHLSHLSQSLRHRDFLRYGSVTGVTGNKATPWRKEV
jgi:hypothetical protein